MDYSFDDSNASDDWYKRDDGQTKYLEEDDPYNIDIDIHGKTNKKEKRRKQDSKRNKEKSLSRPTTGGVSGDAMTKANYYLSKYSKKPSTAPARNTDISEEVRFGNSSENDDSFEDSDNSLAQYIENSTKPVVNRKQASSKQHTDVRTFDFSDENSESNQPRMNDDHDGINTEHYDELNETDYDDEIAEEQYSGGEDEDIEEEVPLTDEQRYTQAMQAAEREELERKEEALRLFKESQQSGNVPQELDDDDGTITGHDESDSYDDHTFDEGDDDAFEKAIEAAQMEEERRKQEALALINDNPAVEQDPTQAPRAHDRPGRFSVQLNNDDDDDGIGTPSSQTKYNSDEGENSGNEARYYGESEHSENDELLSSQNADAYEDTDFETEESNTHDVVSIEKQVELPPSPPSNNNAKNEDIHDNKQDGNTTNETRNLSKTRPPRIVDDTLKQQAVIPKVTQISASAKVHGIDDEEQSEKQIPWSDRMPRERNEGDFSQHEVKQSREMKSFNVNERRSNTFKTETKKVSSTSVGTQYITTADAATQADLVVTPQGIVVEIPADLNGGTKARDQLAMQIAGLQGPTYYPNLPPHYASAQQGSFGNLHPTSFSNQQPGQYAYSASQRVLNPDYEAIQAAALASAFGGDLGVNSGNGSVDSAGTTFAQVLAAALSGTLPEVPKDEVKSSNGNEQPTPTVLSSQIPPLVAHAANFNANLSAANSMFQKNIEMLENSVRASIERTQRSIVGLSSHHYKYTSLDETEEYIKQNRPKVRSLDEALESLDET